MPEIKTVPMVRDDPMHTGGPTSADVHPDEVCNWSAHGWRHAGGSSGHSGQNGAASQDSGVEPTIGELKARATELGLQFRGNASRQSLIAMIAEKEAALSSAASENVGAESHEGEVQ